MLKDNNGFLVFQEDTIKFLQDICGLSGSEADNVRRAIGRKQVDRLQKALPSILEGYCNKSTQPRDIAEKEVQEFLQILSDSAEYQFGYNHSTGYSMIGYTCAYMRYYHTIPFITAYLKNADTDDIPKARELMKQYNVTLNPIKFRYSASEYMPDVENHAIYKGISSIKYFNESIGDTLYSMKDTTFNTFLDFLKVNPCDSRQTQALITLDFFSEFGKSAKLMKIYELYNNLYTKKVLNKNNLPIDEKLIAKYSRETKLQYRDIEMDKLFAELIATIEDKPLPLRQILDTQNEFLGAIEYINPKLDKFMYVTNVDTTYSPKLTCYCLSTGETKVCKISKTIFKENPIKKGDIIAALTERKNKSMKQDGKWVKVEDKFDDWITSYIIK